MQHPLRLALLGLSLTASAVAAPPSDTEASACEPASTLALDEAITGAEVAFRELDVQRFSARMNDVQARLPCVQGRLTPSQASRYHRLAGVSAYLDGDRDSAAIAFAAARAADPGQTMDLAPPGHDLELLWGLAPVSDETMRLDPPAEGVLALDGASTTRRPTDRPVVVQWVPDDGPPRFTAWLPADAPLPPYPVSAVEGPTAEARRRTTRRRVGLVVLGTGAGAALAGAALYGGAAASRASFLSDHPDWTRDDLNRARKRTNTLSDASVATGGLAALCIGTGVALRW